MLNFRIMKARNLLKVLFTMTAVFAFTATFAQNPPYDEMTATQDDGPDMVTVSDNVEKYVPYFVEPDATINSFSGDYDETNSDLEGQGIVTTFTWSYTGGHNFQYQPDNNNDEAPYVEVSFTETGSFELSVEETAPGGGCTGDPVTLNIEVVDEPSFEVTDETDAIEMCDNEAYPIELASIAGNGVSGGDLQFQVDSVVENIDADGNTIDAGGGNPITDETVYHSISEDGNVGGTNVEVFTHDLTARNGEITRYTFTFNGISDHISRKTDYLANQSANDENFTYYSHTSAENTLVYIVYPTPETGDIRYVPESFDL